MKLEIERNKQEMQARDSQFQAQLEAQKEAQRLQIEEASKQATQQEEQTMQMSNTLVALGARIQDIEANSKKQ